MIIWWFFFIPAHYTSLLKDLVELIAESGFIYGIVEGTSQVQWFPPFTKQVVDAKILNLSSINGLESATISSSVYKRELLDMQYIQDFETTHPSIAYFWRVEKILLTTTRNQESA